MPSREHVPGRAAYRNVVTKTTSPAATVYHRTEQQFSFVASQLLKFIQLKMQKQMELACERKLMRCFVQFDSY